VGTAGNLTRGNKVGESTGERQITDGLERIERDDTYKSSTGEYDGDAGYCFKTAARSSISLKNGTLNLSAILLR
jgi:hypothetical protein